jgi:hypothetical protein
LTPEILRTIFSLLLFVHGIGHIQGVLSSLGLFNNDSWHPRSWLFDKLLGEKISRVVAVMLWGLAVLGSLAAAFAFLGIGLPHEIWRTLAVIASIPSSLGLIFYWNSLAMIFNKLGAIAINLWILIGLLLLNWPSESDFGF